MLYCYFVIFSSAYAEDTITTMHFKNADFIFLTRKNILLYQENHFLWHGSSERVKKKYTI